MISLRDLPTPNGPVPLPAADRIDPYWGGLWQLGSDGTWVSRKQAKRLMQSGLRVKRVAGLDTGPGEATARLDSKWETKLDVLGAVSGWRTVTAEQAAALSGNLSIARPKGRSIPDLYALDVIDQGLPNAVMLGSADSGMRFLRPSAGNSFDKIIRPNMTYAEWVSVTGGGQWVTSGQYDRHNILTAELALRVAEFLPAATVLGERFARASDLLWDGVGLVPPPGRENDHQRGDCVLVREDGLRVVVEMTATSGKTLEAKAKQWAKKLSYRSVDDTGVVVLFVVVERQNKSQRRRATMTEARKNLAKALAEFPGTAQNRIADRMFLSNWGDWFPAEHYCSGAFLNLAASKLAVGDEWVPVNLWDELDVYGPANLAERFAVVGAAAGLRSTPVWLRDRGERPVLADVPVFDVGFTTGVTGSFDGPGFDPKLPPRLIY